MNGNANGNGAGTEHPGLSGRVGLDAQAGACALDALREFAHLATPIICESRAELFERLRSGEIDFAFLAVGDSRSGAVIDVYTTLSEEEAAIVGEFVYGQTGTRFLLLGHGQWAATGLRFQTDLQAGGIWLDFPVLAQGRTSVLFALPDEPGALVRALGAISRRHLNVNKLEMRRPDESRESCSIAAEIDGYAHDAPVKEALDELNRLASDVRVLGAYPAAL
ncbi:MAG TPA: prephenate dehydratase domain-containing protein [Chloroflexota bacterium]|jgi:prephenate dehydratase|nr:prephenate dehydratase domain-containing protein [Chloroflexota bacterium]